MNVFIFPSNELGVPICPIFNGHIAIICHNTDRLIDRHYALAEMYAFKYNVQCTSFLHAFGETTSSTLDGITSVENQDYGETIKFVYNTGVSVSGYIGAPICGLIHAPVCKKLFLTTTRKHGRV
ncbi:hypothetical protein ACG9XQ_17650 [Acinetobacter baumannii]|uniref:hypothetical protein n=1 Tax=Acinetobacter baumannii TaxID=470 RepID=UPI00112C38F4|nr:hypothetical protein [Acinetobacter baumannii]TPV29825.1 hypothetical protein FJV20_01680 [Acinetobacter baumannii]CAI3110396.1 hypothetical protein MWMV4_MWMV4_00643 [Acinetobacter baumannii]